MYSNIDLKTGVYAGDLYDIVIGMVFERPAWVYITNNNVDEKGNIAVYFDNFTFFLTAGGIGQNNMFFLPKGARVTGINSLEYAKFCYAY